MLHTTTPPGLPPSYLTDPYGPYPPTPHPPQAHQYVHSMPSAFTRHPGTPHHPLFDGGRNWRGVQSSPYGQEGLIQTHESVFASRERFLPHDGPYYSQAPPHPHPPPPPPPPPPSATQTSQHLVQPRGVTFLRDPYSPPVQPSLEELHRRRNELVAQLRGQPLGASSISPPPFAHSPTPPLPFQTYPEEYSLAYAEDGSDEVSLRPGYQDGEYSSQYSPWSCETISSYIGSKETKPTDVIAASNVEVPVSIEQVLLNRLCQIPLFFNM
uniref:Uncharacterized protein n=1 Tax=Eptatretus burgeri TaxID=7764 RepID=A0A8C4Q5F6_EPTBU